MSDLVTRGGRTQATLRVPSLRWSSVRDCPRKAVYEATRAPHRDRSDREERWLWRGKSLGQEYARFLRHKHGDQAVLTELPVTWPLGVGHMDIYLVPTRTAIEVLSSAHASAEMIHSKLLQLVGYIEHANPDLVPVKAGALVVLNPSDFTDEIFPLARTSRTYTELVEEMRDRIAAVQGWADTGTLPVRVCGRPQDSHKHFCLYAEHCFQDWEAPELPGLAPEAVDLAARFYRCKQNERAAKETFELAESERREVEQQLRDHLERGSTVMAGPLKLRRVYTAPYEQMNKLALTKARGSGFWVDALDQFVPLVGEKDYLTVDRVSDEPLRDWGDVPFTGDERDAA